MESGEVIQLVSLIVLIGLSAFFSSAETALTTVNKIRILALDEEGNKRAKKLLTVIEDSGKMLSAILIGNNIVNLSASALATTLTISLFGSRSVGIATGLLTLFILILGEITPKTLATLYSEKLALAYSGPVWVLMRLLTPVIFIINHLSLALLMLLHIDTKNRNNTMTEHELRTIVDVSREDGVIENEEHQMINNVFDFGDSQAKDIMIPRIDMTFIHVDASYEELLDVFREDGYTRLPVYEDTTDTVIGIINMKDLILYDRRNSFSIRDILREPYFTYEYKNTASLMVEMREKSITFAIVLDEYGATAGLITLEDLLEEIVGEIRDEFDESEEDDVREIVSGREYVVQGATKLDDLNDMLHTSLTSEEYDSIGGYMIEQMDRVPSLGESMITEDGIKLVVDRVGKNRIELVHVYLPEEKHVMDTTEEG